MEEQLSDAWFLEAKRLSTELNSVTTERNILSRQFNCLVDALKVKEALLDKAFAHLVALANAIRKIDRESFLDRPPLSKQLTSIEEAMKLVEEIPTCA